MRVLVAATALAVLAAGCGGGATTTTTPSSSASSGASGAGGPSGGQVPASEQPGGPEPGQPTYTALGSWWKELSQAKRVASASEFIADHPADCSGVKAADLERQTFVAFAYDYPQNAHVSDVMHDNCELLLH